MNWTITVSISCPFRRGISHGSTIILLGTMPYADSVALEIILCIRAVWSVGYAVRLSFKQCNVDLSTDIVAAVSDCADAHFNQELHYPHMFKYRS